MKVTLLAFAQAQDRLGYRELTIECSDEETPRTLLARLAPDFVIAGMQIAVDYEYHDWDAPIGSATEIALIPPVSGG